MTYRYRLIDTAGSEIGIVMIDQPSVADDEVVTTTDGRTITVIEVYDDEHGQDGGVQATLVIEQDEEDGAGDG